MPKPNLGKPVKAAVSALIGVLIISSISLGTVSLFDVDTQSEWSSAVSSSSNVDYADGYLQFQADTATSGSFTSVDYTWNQSGDTVDRVVVEVDDLNSNNSVDVTVNAKEGGTVQTSETVTLEEGRNVVDVSSFADTTDNVSVEFSLSRDAGSDTSPKVDSYVGEHVANESIADLKPVFQLLVIAGAALVVVRTMM